MRSLPQGGAVPSVIVVEPSVHGSSKEVSSEEDENTLLVTPTSSISVVEEGSMVDDAIQSILLETMSGQFAGTEEFRDLKSIIHSDNQEIPKVAAASKAPKGDATEAKENTSNWHSYGLIPLNPAKLKRFNRALME